MQGLPKGDETVRNEGKEYVNVNQENYTLTQIHQIFVIMYSKKDGRNDDKFYRSLYIVYTCI